MRTDRQLTPKDAVAGAVLAVSVTVVGVQMLNPTPIVISVDGGSTSTESLPGFFTYADVTIVAVAAFLAGASATYLFQPRPADGVDDGTDDVDLIEKRRREWAENADDLHDGEREIYEVVLDSDGVVEQSTIVEETDLSKSHVSRKLDVLESKELVERKRRGMGNVVVLK